MGKNNEKLWRWTRIIVPVVATVMLALAAALYASGKFTGKITERVGNVEKTLLDVEASDFSQDETIEEQGKSIVRVETKVDYIQKSVDRIERLLTNDRTGMERTQ